MPQVDYLGSKSRAARTVGQNLVDRVAEVVAATAPARKLGEARRVVQGSPLCPELDVSTLVCGSDSKRFAS